MKRKLLVFTALFLTLFILFSCGEDGGDDNPSEGIVNGGSEGSVPGGSESGDSTEVGGDDTEVGKDNPETGEDDTEVGKDDPETGGDGTEVGKDNPETGGDDTEVGKDDPSSAELLILLGGQSDVDYIISQDGTVAYGAALSLRTSIKDLLGITLTAKPDLLKPYVPDGDGAEIIFGLTDRVAASAAILDYTDGIFADSYFLILQVEDDLVIYATDAMAYEMAVAKVITDLIKDGTLSVARGYLYHEIL